METGAVVIVLRAEHTAALQAWLAATGDDIERLRPALDRARGELRRAETLDRLQRTGRVERHHLQRTTRHPRYLGRW